MTKKIVKEFSEENFKREEQWLMDRQEWEISASAHKQNDRKGQNSHSSH